MAAVSQTVASRSNKQISTVAYSQLEKESNRNWQ